MIDQHSTLSEILTKYRERREDLTLRKMAQIVGLSYSYLGKIERGEFIPPKETIKILADRLELPYYRLLIAAGYKVDLEKDLKTKVLTLDKKELQELLVKYRIYALPDFEKILNESRINKRTFCDVIEISVDKLSRIILLDDYLTLDEAEKICNFFGIKFYEAFQIVRVNYDVKFVGMVDDEDVAMSVHRYIEENRKNFYDSMYRFSQEVSAGKEEDFIIREKVRYYSFQDDELTEDEAIYLKECLMVYRKLKLKPS